MKKKSLITICVILAIVPILFTSGCKKKKKKPSIKKSLLGTWYMAKGRSYILITISLDGKWTSEVRVEGLSSKVVKKRGAASGIWHTEGTGLVISVVKSNINSVWEKGKTLFCGIIKINQDIMTLKYPSGRVLTWKKAQVKKKGEKTIDLSPVVKIFPIVVNLNKISSNDVDRYFCLDMELDLHTLMPGEKPVRFTPRARDAAIMFLSSLIYENVNTFDAIKIEKKKLEKVLNPYLDGTLKNIKINNVLITANIDKANEFVMEHTHKPKASGDKKGKKKT